VWKEGVWFYQKDDQETNLKEEVEKKSAQRGKIKKL
jgi:hypothetical protein